MRRRFLAVVAAAACTAMLLATRGAAGFAVSDDLDAKAEASAASFFGSTKLVRIHLEISAAEYEALQPPRGQGGPGAPPPARQPKKPGERESERNLFGVEFPWVCAQLTQDDHGYGAIGLRYAGNASYMASAGGLKRSFYLDLQRFGRPDFHALSAIHLQSGVLDPTKVRETLAFARFRDAGVPAPRTVLAEVTLTVPGEHSRLTSGSTPWSRPWTGRS